MSIVRDFIVTVVNKDSVVSQVIAVNHRSEHGQRFHLNSSEVEQRSERVQRFHFNSNEVKQRSKHSLRFHFNSSGTKTPCGA